MENAVLSLMMAAVSIMDAGLVVREGTRKSGWYRLR
jgi:hypothetical protein